MRRMILGLSVMLGLGVAMGVCATRVLSAQGESVRRTEILKTDLAGLDGKEGHMWLVVIPPGEATGKHYHPGYEFIYTMDGTGVMQGEGRPTQPSSLG